MDSAGEGKLAGEEDCKCVILITNYGLRITNAIIAMENTYRETVLSHHQMITFRTGPLLLIFSF